MSSLIDKLNYTLAQKNAIMERINGGGVLTEDTPLDEWISKGLYMLEPITIHINFVGINDMPSSGGYESGTNTRGLWRFVYLDFDKMKENIGSIYNGTSFYTQKDITWDYKTEYTFTSLRGFPFIFYGNTMNSWSFDLHSIYLDAEYNLGGQNASDEYYMVTGGPCSRDNESKQGPYRSWTYIFIPTNWSYNNGKETPMEYWLKLIFDDDSRYDNYPVDDLY